MFFYKHHNCVFTLQEYILLCVCICVPKFSAQLTTNVCMHVLYQLIALICQQCISVLQFSDD